MTVKGSAEEPLRRLSLRYSLSCFPNSGGRGAPNYTYFSFSNAQSGRMLLYPMGWFKS